MIKPIPYDGPFTDPDDQTPFGTWATNAEYQIAYNAAKTSPDRMRAFYGLPPYAKRGCPVLYRGKRGVITDWDGARVLVLLDGATRSESYHPLDLGYPVTDPKAAP